MGVFIGIVKYNGNHYHAGQIVIGSDFVRKGESIYLFDDNLNYVDGVGDLTRNEYVEVSVISTDYRLIQKIIGDRKWGSLKKATKLYV